MLRGSISGLEDKDIKPCKSGIKGIDELEDFYYKTYLNMKKGIIPKEYPKVTLSQNPSIYYISRNLQLNPLSAINGPKIVNWRYVFVENFGYPLYSEDWVKPLAKWIGDRPCLEIMAGSGFLSKLLSNYGVNIKATDNYSWSDRINILSNVEKLDCIEAIRKYGKDVKFIILSWPYMDSNAYYSLLEMRKVNPNCRMIYIGETFGGCTADIQFFNTAEFEQLVTFEKAVEKYRRWENIHDIITLLK